MRRNLPIVRLCRRFAPTAALAFLLGAAVVPAAAQCALCYESASQASKNGQKAITRAIGVLLIPPLGMMAGLVTLAVRYKGRNEREAVQHEHPIPPLG